MQNQKGIKLLSIGIILILIQSFFQYHDEFMQIYSKYIGYLIPMIYAFFIAVFLEPIVTFFEKKCRLKRVISIMATLLLIVLLITGFVGIIAPQIGRSIKELYDKLPIMQVKVEGMIENVVAFLKQKELLVIGEDEIEQNILNFIKKNTSYIQNFGISAVLNVVGWTVSLTKFFIGFFLGVLILFNKEYFIEFIKNVLTASFGKSRSKGIVEFLIKSREILLKFVCGRIIVSAAVGFITFFVMLVTKTPYAVLTGVMMGVGNMIPYVGSIVAGLLAIFLVALASPSKLIFLFVAVLVAQAVDGWIIGPKVVGESVGMNTFWIIVSILIGGSLLGPLGMFFGVPAFAMIKLVYYKFLNREQEIDS